MMTFKTNFERVHRPTRVSPQLLAPSCITKFVAGARRFVIQSPSHQSFSLWSYKGSKTASEIHYGSWRQGLYTKRCALPYNRTHLVFPPTLVFFGTAIGGPNEPM
jgi:hypothetical protein